MHLVSEIEETYIPKKTAQGSKYKKFNKIARNFKQMQSIF